MEWRLDRHTTKTESCWLWQGATLPNGYGHIYLNGKMQYCHRVQYIRFLGEIPESMYIDHICRTRNCINPEHLRLATVGENAQNTSIRSDNGTGYKGVHYYKSRDKYTSRITFNGVDYNLGYFNTAEDAWKARQDKELELFTHSPLVVVE